MKRKMHPNSLANLRPPFKKGEVHNPRGINGPLGKFLEGPTARAIVGDVRAEGLPATPALLAQVTARVLLPDGDELAREKAVRELLLVYRRELRRATM